MRFDIPESELEWRFDTSGGPGGQHANRSNTRVTLVFNVEASEAFDEEIIVRIVSVLGPSVTVVEGGSRSQTTNRRRAKRRLLALLEEAARPPAPPRRRTRPSERARQRRVADKRARGAVKRQRRTPAAEE